MDFAKYIQYYIIPCQVSSLNIVFVKILFTIVLPARPVGRDILNLRFLMRIMELVFSLFLSNVKIYLIIFMSQIIWVNTKYTWASFMTSRTTV